MVINSLEFLLFVAITVIIYKIIPPKIKWVVLLIASYLFYFLNSTYMTIAILTTTVSVYLIALKIKHINERVTIEVKEIENKEQKKKRKKQAKTKQKSILTMGILFNLGILVVLKYSGFIGENINSLFSILHMNVEMPIAKFILPIGISYYTLQAISYIVDVYRG